jgi:hypothetical protein
VDVTQGSKEVFIGSYNFTTKAVLKQMAFALVFLVVVPNVTYAYTLYNLPDCLFAGLNKQMYMIAHEAVSV